GPVVLAALVVAALVVFAGAATQAAPPQTLESWVHEFPPLQDALSKKWIPEFAAAHPGVRVKVTAIPFAGVVAYDAKLLSALSGGAGPDLWDMGDWHYKVFTDNKFVAPLDPTVFGYASTKEMIDAYVPGTTSIFERDGKLYGLFSEYNTLALFYNLDMFKAAGVAPLPADKPVSWRMIADIAKKLTQRDSAGKLTQIGYRFGFFANFRSPQWYAQDFYALMRQYGQPDRTVNANKPQASQRLAQQFLASMLGKKGETEQAVWWFKTVGYTHPKKVFYQSAGYKQELAKNPWLKAWESAFTTYKIDYVTHNFDEVGQALIRAIDRVVYDQMRPAETGRLLQAELGRLMGTK